MKREFIKNILKAKEYETKALACLLPDAVRPHVKAIQRELAAMVWDCVSEEKKSEEGGQENGKKNVHKVDIQ